MEQFPQEITAVFTVKIRIDDQEQKDYLIDPTTGELTIGVIADMYNLCSELDENNVISVNNMTRTQIKNALQLAAGA